MRPPVRGDDPLRELFGQAISPAVLGDALPAGIFLADTAGACLYTNPRLRVILGLDESGPDRQDWTKMIHPDDRRMVLADWAHATSRRAEWRRDFRVRHLDGSDHWVSARTAPIRNDAGRVIGHMGTVEDITSRKAIEQAAIRADERQRLLQSKLAALVAASGTLLELPTLGAVLPALMSLAKDLIAADGYAVWRLIEGVGWRAESSAGVSPQFVSQIVSEYTDPGQRRLTFDSPLFIDDIGTTQLLRGREKILAAEGILSLLVVPLRTSGNRIGTLAFYYRERRQADPVDLQTAAALGNLAAAAVGAAELYEAQLRNQHRADRARQRATFLADASATLASSLDYEVTLRTVAELAVPRIADSCGVYILESDRIVRLAATHSDPEKSEQADAYRERFPEAGIAIIVEKVVQSRGPILVSPITDAHFQGVARSPEHLEALRQIGPRAIIAAPMVSGGRIRGVISFVTWEPERLYEHDDLQLAMAVAARAALAVDNAAAYAEARAANRMKDEFLATLSHEMRTPINAIMGWAQMLQRGIVEPARVSHAVEAIVRNAAAQTRLIEDLLDVSRIITGKFRLDVDAVDIGTVISAAIAAVEPGAHAKGVRLDVTMDNAPIQVYGDRHRLQQAVWNLLANAIKFTGRDGRVEVSVRAHDGLADIEVADTGTGIHAETLPYIFDRFRQADSSPTRQHTGMGLGLAIVRHIVELHGGSVTATSEGEDHGATFRIRLPLNVGRPAAETGAGAAPMLTADSLAVPPLPGLADTTVLLVEDDEDAREMVAYMLRQRQATVLTAASAADALALLDRERPDVLVSDVEMPERDGFSLIAEVRRRSADRGGMVPAAALTAHSSPEDRARSLLAGFDAHLSKPVDLNELIATVIRLKTHPPGSRAIAG